MPPTSFLLCVLVDVLPDCVPVLGHLGLMFRPRYCLLVFWMTAQHHRRGDGLRALNGERICDEGWMAKRALRLAHRATNGWARREWWFVVTDASQPSPLVRTAHHLGQTRSCFVPEGHQPRPARFAAFAGHRRLRSAVISRQPTEVRQTQSNDAASR